MIIEVLLNLFKKAFTRKYPKERFEPFERFRGMLVYYSKKCIGCRKCERYCPSKCIKFYKKGSIDFDISSCIFCGLCVDVCPTSAIEFIKDFEYAKKSKKELMVNENKRP